MHAVGGVPSASEDWLLCDERIEGGSAGADRMDKSLTTVRGDGGLARGWSHANRPSRPCVSDVGILSPPPRRNSASALGSGSDSPPGMPPPFLLEPGGRASSWRSTPPRDPPPMPPLSPSANRCLLPRVTSWHRCDSPIRQQSEGRSGDECDSDEDITYFGVELDEFSMAVEALNAEDKRTAKRENSSSEPHGGDKRRRLH